MDIKNEIGSYLIGGAGYKSNIEDLGEETCKKIGAILDILEAGDASIAHSKLVLHTCEDIIERCSLTLGTRRDV